MEPVVEMFLNQMDETLRKEAIIASVYEKISYRVQKASKKGQIDPNSSVLKVDIELNPQAHCLVIGFNSHSDFVIIKNEEDFRLLDDFFFKSELFPRNNSALKIEKADSDEITYRYSFVL